MDIPRDWTFESADIALRFDRHIREQLPWYDFVTGAIAHIARHYLPRGGTVYDIGASTGNIGRALAPLLTDRGATLIPIEASEAMAARYDGPGAENLLVTDAAAIDYAACDLAILFLVLMFVPIADRSVLLGKLAAALRPGGAMIIVDKTPPLGGYVSTVLARLALAGKLAAGVDPGEIIAKELALAGAQRPLPPGLLDGATEWFRLGEFAGWIIEAPAP